MTVQSIKTDSNRVVEKMEKDNQPALKFSKMSNVAQKEQSRENSFVDPYVQIQTEIVPVDAKKSKQVRKKVAPKQPSIDKTMPPNSEWKDKVEKMNSP